MQKRNLKGLNHWPPGVSGNPKGRPPNRIPRELEVATRETLKEAIEFLFSVPVTEARRIAKSEEYPAYVTWLAKVLIGAGNRGDFLVIDKLIDRVIGKPK